MAKISSKENSSKESAVPFLEGLTFLHLVIVLSALLCSEFIYENIVLTNELRLAAGQLNNTVFAERDVLFFNRVPKVGSQTIIHILEMLQRRNNFTHYWDNSDIKAKDGERTYMGTQALISYGDMFLANFTPPTSYSKHTAFIEFKELGDQYFRPIYINFVREPVQRLVSWYYYVRAPWYLFVSDWNSGNETYKAFKPGFGDSATKYKMSFEDCIDQQNPECTYIEGRDHMVEGLGGSHASQIMFFCGHKPFCKITNGKEAFREAISNVEKYYSVVGILEDLEKSLFVMEKMIPRFFDGITESYPNWHQGHKHRNQNKFRPHTSEIYKDMVRRNLSREMEFYEYCKQRLNKQYLALTT